LLSSNAKVPARADLGAAGYDIYALEDGHIEKNKVTKIKTGISLEFPQGYYARIAPRSGLSVKGVDVLAGVIDSSYRGEIVVLATIHTEDALLFKAGDRIAQLIFEKIATPDIIVVDDLSATERGDGGFGSSDSRLYLRQSTCNYIA
jgi:dUTP pyrophosphatase